MKFKKILMLGYSGNELNCIIYPPIAFVTKEARVRKQKIFLNNLKGFLEGNVQNKVN